MATYGLLIQPEDGGKATDITAGSRIPTYKGFFNPAMSATGTTNQNVPVEAGASIFVIPNTVVDIFFNSTEANPIVNCLDGLNINGGNITSTTRGNYRNPTGRASYLRYSVFQVMGAASTVSRYGLALIDASDYMEISDASIVGGCVFRQRITVNGSWVVPGDVVDRDRCIVFANWSHPSYVVSYDDRTKTISAWGANATPVSLDINVCIFGSGTAPVPPQYGLALYSATGACTFSSRKAPLLLRGSATLSRNIGQAATMSGTYNTPMVPLGVWGIYVISGGRYEVFYAGLTMNDRTVSTGGSARYTSVPNSYGGLSSVIAPVNLPVLDATDYF